MLCLTDSIRDDDPSVQRLLRAMEDARSLTALILAAWQVARQPGPLHAFYERTRARRGHGKAIVATARKLAVLFWCMLARQEDYAHQQPSLTRKKLRRLEITAGAPNTPAEPKASGQPMTSCAKPSSNSRAKPKPPTSAWSKTNKPPAQPKKRARA